MSYESIAARTALAVPPDEVMAIEDTELHAEIVESSEPADLELEPVVFKRNGRSPEGLERLARGYSGEAICTAIRIMRSKREPAKTRLKAVEIILERGYGKAGQAVEVNWSDSTPEQREARLLGLLSIVATGVSGPDGDIGD